MRKQYKNEAEEAIRGTAIRQRDFLKEANIRRI